MTFGVSGHFYVWTASLIRLSIIERITVSVKRKTDLKIFCYTILGACALLLEVRTEQNTLDLELFQIT